MPTVSWAYEWISTNIPDATLVCNQTWQNNSTGSTYRSDGANEGPGTIGSYTFDANTLYSIFIYTYHDGSNDPDQIDFKISSSPVNYGDATERTDFPDWWFSSIQMLLLNTQVSTNLQLLEQEPEPEEVQYLMAQQISVEQTGFTPKTGR